MNIAIPLFYITFVFAVLANSLSLIDILLLFLSTLLTTIYIRKSTIMNNLAAYIQLLLIWVPTVFMPSFHMVVPIMKSYTSITPDLNNQILSMGISIYTFFVIVLCICQFVWMNPSKVERKFLPKTIPINYIKIGLLCCIILSIFCYSIGLGRMGSEGVELPLHLGGIINLLRSMLIPILFAVVIEGYVLRNKIIPKSIWIYYIIWCLIETFAWLSKAILVRDLLPSLMILYIYYKPSIGKIVKFVIPLLFVFFLLYPIVEIMRNDKDSSLVENFSNAKDVANEEENNIKLLKPLNRTFLFGAQYAQDLDYLSNNSLFDFSRLPLIVSLGGAAKYQTFYIDGFPVGAIHSSGTSGLMDPLLHGGKGLLYVIVLILVFFSLYTDRLFDKGYVSIAIVLIQMILFFNITENVTSLYNGNGFQMLIVYGIGIYISYKMNYSRRASSLDDKYVKICQK